MLGYTFEDICTICKKFMATKEHTYYPNEPHKNNVRITIDLLKWFFKYKEINVYYYLYGFDCLNNREPDSYEDHADFTGSRNKGNRVGNPSSWISLLRDKYLFYRYMKANGLLVPEIFAVMMDGRLFNQDLEPISIETLKNRKDYFLKDIDGECGNGIEHISDFAMLQVYIERAENKNFILQERVHQHDLMNRLNPNSVNTIRVVTVMKDGFPLFYNAFLRIGSKNSEYCDNTSQGGIAVGIDESGKLTEVGFRKPKYGGRTSIHPDTGIAFHQFRIPYYQDAVEMALTAHRLFYRVKSIGWDIAITPDGPIFIEGNDNWEIQTFQALYGGQRRIIKELLR